ncbi:MAG: pyroglutamyl-peptidase I [Opitutaceae bacterium]|nr:pyroglutamyl-peptidase I [Opitutaceae bacterium]
MNSKTRQVLVTGFEPFGGETVNPSALIASSLDGEEVDGAWIVGRVLPCVFDEAASRLTAWVDECDPQVVLCLGQAGGRTGITVERVAINLDDARIPDNRGAQPVDRPIVRGAPVGYWSTLPIKAMVSDLREAGVPASVSQTAGTFVCNHVFYSLMHHLAARPAEGRIAAGFVHVPWLPEQAARQTDQPSLPLEVQLTAVRHLVRTALMGVERHVEGGSES